MGFRPLSDAHLEWCLLRCDRTDSDLTPLGGVGSRPTGWMRGTWRAFTAPANSPSCASSPEDEAVRDLIRVRKDVKRDRRIAIQRLKSFLLRYGQRYPKPNVGWSHPFENWGSSSVSVG